VTGLLVVTNTAAGGIAGDHSPRPAVQRALAVLKAASDVRAVATTSPDELDDVLMANAGRHPVVVGGDGSLRAVVQALYRTGLLDRAPAVGLIPLGTGNDLARAAGIPLDPVAAAQVIVEAMARTGGAGSARGMELLVDDVGGIVVNAVHLGIGALAARTASRWKKRLGTAAYALGSVVAGMSAPGWRLSVEADGEVLADMDRRVLMVGLGLGTSIGGGSPLAPLATPEDGLVDVVISFAVGPVARVAYALRLRRGAHLHRPDVRLIWARQVVVSGEPFLYNADGDIGGPVRQRTWTVRRDAWHLLVGKP
jgi:diacylglycerol kinase family enzyme